MGINTVVVTGRIASDVQVFAEGAGKIVFTLQNTSGRYYVQWSAPPYDAPTLTRGAEVVVQGSLFSRQRQGGADTSGINAQVVQLTV